MGEIYLPREDTYLLLEAALAEARPEDIALEIGCGSGLISRELAKRVSFLLATDINPHAVRAAREEGIEVVRADLFSGLKGKFDLILFNPPYLPTSPEERAEGWINYALDGGEDGRWTIGRFISALPHMLRPGGRAMILISSLTGKEEVLEMCRDKGLMAQEVLSERCFFEQLHVIKLFDSRMHTPQ